jgi:hypothetical protein
MAIRLFRKEEIVRPDREGWMAPSQWFATISGYIFSNIRDGCLRSSSYVLKSRQVRLPQDGQLRMYACSRRSFLVFFLLITGCADRQF